MQKFIVFLSLLVLVVARDSPNGKEYLSSLSSDELRAIPEDVLEDAMLDVPGLLNKYGYPPEVHNVETEDGYIITMHRIGARDHGKSREDRIPVLLMHGLMGASSDWILNGPGKGLGYILTDAGYDVWLGNARGNYYSRNHVSLSPEGRKFWMFSWNEIGHYDLPAMIDHILEITGRSKIHYVGHSQGTTSFFVMGSTRPAYNDKIMSMQALAPAAYMNNMNSRLIRTMAKYATSIQYLLTLIGQNEFFSKSEFITKFAQENCHVESDYMQFCLNILFGSDNYEQINVTLVPLYLSHVPAGAASRQFVHYALSHLSGKFRKYDYGSFANIVAYGWITPPNYKLGRISAPVALHFSDNDDAVAEVDVIRLHDEIANPIGLFRVPRPSFTHMDFIWAMDAPSILFDRVMEIMKSFE